MRSLEIKYASATHVWKDQQSTADCKLFYCQSQDGSYRNKMLWCLLNSSLVQIPYPQTCFVSSWLSNFPRKKKQKVSVLLKLSKIDYVNWTSFPTTGLMKGHKIFHLSQLSVSWAKFSLRRRIGWHQNCFLCIIEVNARSKKFLGLHLISQHVYIKIFFRNSKTK